MPTYVLPGDQHSSVSVELSRPSHVHGDSHYVIGKGHAVCQDYAHSGSTGPIAYGIVCDGCSSTPDTDVGARLLAWGARRVLVRGLPLSAVGRFAPTFGRDSPTPPTCMDATLLVALIERGSASMAVFGDGAVAVLAATGEVTSVVVETDENSPPYPSYTLHIKRFDEYVKAGLGTTRYSIVGPLDGVDGITSPEKAAPGEAGLVLTCDVKVPPKVIAVFSDGVASFRDADEEPVDPHAIIAELTAFKTFPGAFVQRRMRAFLRDCATRGWTHHDDLAMAAVYLGDA